MDLNSNFTDGFRQGQANHYHLSINFSKYSQKYISSLPGKFIYIKILLNESIQKHFKIFYLRFCIF